MMSSYANNRLKSIRTQHLLRERMRIDHRHGNLITIGDKTLVNFCSNDYLQLAQHPEVKKAFIRSAQHYGLGSGASPLLSGFSSAHYRLEAAAAEFLQRDRAIIFNSGYHANLAVLTTFADRTSTVVADKLCHRSLLDGILLSRATYRRYQHNNLKQAATLLGTAQQKKLLITESIFGMQGNMIDMHQYVALAIQQHAMLIVDDAHGIGILGANGRGVCEQFALSQTDIPCLISPLGKAVGSVGAIVSGRADIIELLLQLANTYRYSTAPPPAICDATTVAMRITQKESWRRQKLAYLSCFFNSNAQARAIPLIALNSIPIKSILVGSNQIALKMQKELIKHGFFTACIRPPTVPVNTTRLRISLNCAHNETQILQLLDKIKELHDTYSVQINC